jgi:transposase-like protein
MIARAVASRRRPHSQSHPPTFLLPPWHDRKSRRGAPKRIATQGFACPHRACPYYQITDAQIHALVGDGTHAKTERIQTLRCQACQTTFSARLNTPLYRLKTASHRVAEVLAALAEGLSLAAAVRVFGHRVATITRWLTRAPQHSATLHEHRFHHLQLPHVQLDEIRTRLRSHAHTLWLWMAVDPLTKIIPVLYLGARNQIAAHTIVHTLHRRLASDCIPVFTSHGLRLYFYALTAHFGHWVAAVGRRARRWQLAAGLIYGQVKKTYRRRKLLHVSRVMRCGTHVELTTALKKVGLSGRLNTAFIERLKKDRAAERGCLGTPDLVDSPASATVTDPPSLVAGLLPFRAAARVIARGAGAAHRPRRQACTATLSATESGNGCRTDTQALECPRGAGASARANTDRCRLRQGKQGRTSRQAHQTGTVRAVCGAEE